MGSDQQTQVSCINDKQQRCTTITTVVDSVTSRQTGSANFGQSQFFPAEPSVATSIKRNGILPVSKFGRCYVI
jgi:hypothetical protein